MINAEERPASEESAESVVLRALHILDVFTEAQPQQSLQAICQQTGLPPSTAHRLLGLLILWGGVERVARGRYRLSLHVWRLGAGVAQARQLRDVALPYLQDLLEVTQEVVHLGVREGLNVLYVEKLLGKQADHAAAASRVGRRLPLYATGPGKVLLSYSGEAVIQRVIDQGLPAMTANTTTEEKRLRRALAEIRHAGMAVSREEMNIGACSLAAPIFSADGEIIASVSVVTSPERFDVPQLRPVVQAVGRAITRGLSPSRTLPRRVLNSQTR